MTLRDYFSIKWALPVIWPLIKWWIRKTLNLGHKENPAVHEWLGCRTFPAKEIWSDLLVGTNTELYATWRHILHGIIFYSMLSLKLHYYTWFDFIYSNTTSSTKHMHDHWSYYTSYCGWIYSWNATVCNENVFHY